MSGDKYPKFRAAAVQAAPVFLDRDATIDKVETLLGKATANGAKLVVFPESFIPAFRYGVWFKHRSINIRFSQGCMKTHWTSKAKPSGNWLVLQKNTMHSCPSA
jgi:predicted amidohydrolase